MVYHEAFILKFIRTQFLVYDCPLVLNRGQMYHLKYLCDAGAKKEIEVAHFLTWHTHFSSIITVIRQNRQIHKLLLGLTKFRQICRLRYCMYVSERFKIFRFILFPLWKSNLWTKPGVFRLRVQLFCSQSTTLRIYSHERMLQMKVRRPLRIGFHSHFLRWILRGCLHGGGGPRVGEVTCITY